MTDTTTIEITEAQKAALEDLKEHPKEPIKDTVGRVIDSYNDESDSDDVASNSAEDVTATLDATERRKIAKEVAEVLR